MTDPKHAAPAAPPGIEVKRVGTALGAEIRGIDATAPLDEGTAAFLRAAHAEHEVIVLPGQALSGEQLRAFGQHFGPLSVHPFSTNDAETPDLIVYDNHPGNPPLSTDVWHTDETFRETPPMGTMLCSKIVPELGGDTVFASMTAVYEGLSDRMQRHVSGLEAVHDFKPFKALFGESKEDRARLRFFEERYPPVTHPVVREHPVTGRMALFVNPQFTLHIKGMEERESRALLDVLFQQTLVPEYQYRHRWQPDMLVFWDNRAAQHYACHDYYPQRRKMIRVTIAGDRPFGPAAADPATLRRRKMPAVGEVPTAAQRQHQRELAEAGME